MSYSRTLIENNIPILQKAILQKYSDIIQCIYSKYLRIKHEELSVTKIHPSNYVQSLQNLIVSDIGHLKMTKEAFCNTCLMCLYIIGAMPLGINAEPPVHTQTYHEILVFKTSATLLENEFVSISTGR